MRGIAWTLALLVALSSTVFGAEPQDTRRHRWVRRLSLAAACAASFWDIQTTRAGIGEGAHEANPLFADALGRPRWGRIIGFKAGLCAAPVIAEERFARGPSDRLWTGVNIVTAATFTATAVHNLKVAGDSALSHPPR